MPTMSTKVTAFIIFRGLGSKQKRKVQKKAMQRKIQRNGKCS